MNFVMVSPHFPPIFRRFAVRLKENGINVLGLGDAPYEELHPELRGALTEYFKVDDMENYDQMVRALGYFTFHYGQIDWLESNNEYWLEMDAALRTAFHITTGPMTDTIKAYKSKLAMKAYFEKAGVPSARCQPVTDLAAAQKFVKAVGYPVVVKPDNGVGAESTYRLTNDEDLENFFFYHPDVPYLMEEHVPGVVTTYDGVCNSKGEVLYAVSHVTPTSIMDMVNDGEPTFYYMDKSVPADVEKAGKAVLKAFGVTRRFFHFEFFRLTQDKPGLGKKGKIVALEVNMRPAGGYTTEMINYGQSIDIYQIYADMVAFDEMRHTYTGPKTYCVYAGRRDEVAYELNLGQLQAQCEAAARLFCRMPRALSGAMGNQVAICCYDTRAQMNRFVKNAFAPPKPVKSRKRKTETEAK